jgi:hypothetical protein
MIERQRLRRLLTPRPAGLRNLPSQAVSYRDLARSSLDFDLVDLGTRPAALNVMVPSIASRDFFAGPRTAIDFARGLALELQLPLPIVTTVPDGAPTRQRTGPQVVRIGDGEELRASHDDVWVVTHWVTAHAADVAGRLGVLDPARVAYLVQDYEPGFEPWSSQYAIAASTYHAGFHLVVNSAPLARHLTSTEGVAVPESRVFAPNLNLERLQEVAARRHASERTCVFFYARPSRPRNLFSVGVTALRRAVDLLGRSADTVDVVTAGEAHGVLDLGADVVAQRLGKTSWDEYFDLLARVNVGLSLMYSPHPSHPPLELAVSGALAVTNEFAATRATLHPRLLTCPADADALARRLVEAISLAREEQVCSYMPIEGTALGAPMESVIASTARALAG